MKTLLLMRHAKSSWKHAELSDQDRPLNKKGKKDAPVMGHWIKEHNLIPQLILCSSALRAKQTAEIVAEVSGYTNKVECQDSLYMAEADGYLAALQLVAEDVNCVMVVGHNPGLETLLQILIGEIESLPTAVVGYLSLPIDHWSQINSDTRAENFEIWRPREVRKEEEKISEKEKEKDKKKKK